MTIKLSILQPDKTILVKTITKVKFHTRDKSFFILSMEDNSNMLFKLSTVIEMVAILAVDNKKEKE